MNAGLSINNRAIFFLMAGYIWVLPVEGTVAARNTFFLLLVAAFVFFHSKPKERLYFPLIKQWTLYASIALFSINSALNPAYSLGEIKTEILIPLILFFLAANLIKSENDWRKFMGLIIIGNFVLVALSIIYNFTGEATKDGLTATINTGVGKYSTYMILVMPLMIGSIALERKRIFLALGIAALVLAGIASIYLTFNRQSFVTLIVELSVAATILFLMPAYRRYWPWCLGGSALLMSLFYFQYATKNPLAAQNLLWEIQSDVRWLTWTEVINHIKKNLMIGSGFGLRSFAFAFPDLAANSPFWHGHNLFINKAVQMGIPGLVIFIILIGSVFFKIIKGLKGSESIKIIALAGAAMIVGMVTKNMTDDFFYRETGYLFWLLTGAVIGVVQHQGLCTRTS
ncbi:O-antigen ligase [Azovibrio restrictus]|uniref:O-antigen ligase family protein n=1 Tax=Azovibrio restrictus TaxID=146938 RepID=UPI0026F01587|nr:O-antigen ligase family protein [Azovibrio restrictus]MDD3483737.1 O-antigen ligase family protein [Azovibrio restrictus]